MDSPAGDDVLDDRYELRGKVRRGRDCHVYLACDLVEQRDVTLTVLPSGSVVDQDRFERERALLERADSPVLVPLLAASGPDSAVAYVVSELVDAEPLEARLARTSLRPELVRRIGLDLAAGLAALHRVGAAHGGVEPANVLVPPIVSAGRLAARLKGFGGGASAGGDDAPTTAGDVRALGMLLLACLRGGAAAPAAAAEATHPADVPTGTPAALVELIAAMTDPEPDRRPTAEDVAVTLHDLGPLVPRRSPIAASMPLGTATAPASALRPPRGPIPGARPRHRLPWFAAVGTSGVAAVGIVLLTISASVLQPQGSIHALPRVPAAPAAGTGDGAAADMGASAGGTASGSGGRSGAGAPSTVRAAKQDAIARLVGSTATASTAAAAAPVSLALARSTTTTGPGGSTPASGTTAAQPGASGAPTPSSSPASSSTPSPSSTTTPSPSGTPTTSPSPSSPASPSPSSSPSSPSPTTSPSSSPSSSPSPKPSSSSPTPEPPTSTPTSDPAPSSTPTSDPAPSSPPTSDPAPTSDPSPSSTATSDPAPSATSDPSPTASSPSSDPAPSTTTDPAPTASASTATAEVAAP